MMRDERNATMIILFPLRKLFCFTVQILIKTKKNVKKHYETIFFFCSHIDLVTASCQQTEQQWVFLPARWCRAVVPRYGAGGQRWALLQGGSAGGHHGRSGGQSEGRRPGCRDTHTLMDLLDSVCGDCCDFSANSFHIISVSILYRNYVQYEFKNIMTDSWKSGFATFLCLWYDRDNFFIFLPDILQIKWLISGGGNWHHRHRHHRHQRVMT